MALLTVFLAWGLIAEPQYPQGHILNRRTYHFLTCYRGTVGQQGGPDPGEMAAGRYVDRGQIAPEMIRTPTRDGAK